MALEKGSTNKQNQHLSFRLNFDSTATGIERKDAKRIAELLSWSEYNSECVSIKWIRRKLDPNIVASQRRPIAKLEATRSVLDPRLSASSSTSTVFTI